MTTQQFTATINGQTVSNIGSFKAWLNNITFVGHAKLTLPYTESDWGLWSQKDTEVTITAGATNPGVVFHGHTANPIINQQKYITVELNDFGTNFQVALGWTYSAQTVEEVLTTLCSQCGYAIDLSGVSSFVLSKQISRSSTIENPILQPDSSGAPFGDTSSTISGSFECSCPSPSTIYTSGFYITAISNYCPYCQKYHNMIIDSSISQNQYKCTNCGTTYCGIDGDQTSGDLITKIPIIEGPTPGTITGKEPSYSTVNNITYEDEIRTICNNNNLYIYLTQDSTVIVKEFTGIPSADFTITADDVEYQSYKFVDSSNKQISEVYVNYNGGTAVASDPNLTTATNPIVLDHPEMNLQDAQNLANSTLLTQLQGITSEIYINILLNAGISPGGWINIPASPNPTNINLTGQTMYLESMIIDFEARNLQIATLRMKYSPAIAQQITNVPETTTQLTLDQILIEAASFPYSPLCTTYQCVATKRVGESHGISAWLFQMISAIGTRCRIISFDSPYLITSNFECVQIYTNGSWNDVNYAAYNFDPRIIPGDIRSNVQIVMSG
jgi:hypothetical protein